MAAHSDALADFQPAYGQPKKAVLAGRLVRAHRLEQPLPAEMAEHGAAGT